MTPRHRQLTALALCLTVYLSLGFQCGGSRGLRRDLVDGADRYANAVRLARGVLEDLHAAGKVSDSTARAYAERLLVLNSLGRKAGQLIRANLDRIPERGQLPADLRTDLGSILDAADAAIRGLQGFSDAPLLRATSDILAAVNSIRRTVEAFR